MKRSLAAVVAVITGMTWLPGMSPTASGAAPTSGTVRRSIMQSPASVRAYWTPERMRAAKPLALKLSQADPRLTRQEPDAPATSETVIAPSAPAAGSASITLTRETKSQQQNVGFDSEEIVNVTDFPYVTHGKLFFSLGGSRYVCSATVVNSQAHNVIVTAGHCLYDNDAGVFSSNVMFVPGYRDGDRPFGSWVAEELFVRPEWQNGNFNYDFAAAVMGPQNDGDEVQDVTGARGIVFNRVAPFNFDAHGYPAADPFDGERLIHCVSDPAIRDGSGLLAPHGIGCDMTEGSSGGGWVVEAQYVNSVTSYGYTKLPNMLFGPYLGTAAEDLFESAAGESTDPDPSPTPTPTVSPTPDPTEPVLHEMDLGLRLRNHLVAKGTMTTVDGFAACSRNAPVEIYRMIDSTTGRYVKESVTGDNGTYSIRLPDRKGRYFAYSPEGFVDDLNLCGEDFSSIVRHRH